MARPLRIQYPGAVYHVMNRGNDRQRVFHSARFYELFLKKLEQFTVHFGVTIRAYCLMPNHFHLYVATSEGNLSRFMQSLLTSYTVVANRWRQSSGHIFQGRYKALLVEDELYGSRVSRYIHLNPVAVKSLANASLEEKVQGLYAFKWSSFPALTGAVPLPAWLDGEATWKRWGSDRNEQMSGYAAYVQEGLGVSLASPFEDAVAGAVLGSKLFVDRIARQQFDELKTAGDQPGAQVLSRMYTPEEVLAATCRHFAIPLSCLTQKGNRTARDARLVAVYGLASYCRAGTSQASMAAIVGLKPAGFISAVIRAKREMKADNRIVQEAVHAIEAMLKDGNHNQFN